MPVDLLSVCVWTLILTHSALVCCEVHILEVSEGDSVLLPCSLDRGQPAPYGVSLKRTWRRNNLKVLFKHEDSPCTASNPDDLKRITVSGDPRDFRVNVSIGQLTASDTDRYVCDFIINQDNSEDQTERGTDEFFILVNAGGQCGCSSYSSLLYALSSAVVVLLLLLLIGLLLLCRSKTRRSAKSHPAAPIYEEMTVVQPPSRKLGPRHLEETDCSEYNNCPPKRSSENHYEVPIGGPPRGAPH